MLKLNRFNLRVYAILSNHNGEVLITHERYAERQFYKFPGGGLEFGEGALDCVQRELKEELGIEIETLEHFFTTDEFVPSAFRKEDQIVSIYYKAQILENEVIAQVDSNPGSAEILERIWVKPSDLESYLSFPMDLKVLVLLNR